MAKASFKKLSQELGCLSDENRMEMICFLQNKERCVCEIWQELDLPQNLASHHLKVLRDNKLVKSRKDGLKVYYSLEQQSLKNLFDALGDLLINKKKGEI